MIIKWNKLYDICEGNNKLSGTKFEEIVLIYLKEYYPQYSWESTKSSWDNNRDFVSLVLENIWAEAKYKKDCSALKKQDIDPTMMSGLLDGNVEIIFFITNGYLPPTIMERIKQASNMCFFNIICITRVQLEYWLILRPDIYKYYFKEELKIQNVDLPKVAFIKSIEIIDYASPNNNILFIKKELSEKHFYTMNISFEANEFSEIEIVRKEYPFSFINAPGYAEYTKIEINPGIQQVQLLIYIDNCADGVISLEYIVNNTDKFSFTINVRIYPNQKPILSYSQQLVYKEQIISQFSDTSLSRLVTLGGKKNMGKTHLLQDILYHFRQTRQTVCFSFYPINDYRNKMMICRLITFINFGEIVRVFNIGKSDSIIDYYRVILETHFDSIGGDIDIILKVFEGCYDEFAAANTIEFLYLNCDAINKVILPQQTPVSHLALIDDIDNLNDIEHCVFYKIIKRSLICNNASFLMTAQNSEFLADFELKGLSSKDIEYSLRNNFDYWPKSFIRLIGREFSNIPCILCESIQFLKINLKGASEEELLTNYILLSDKAMHDKGFEWTQELSTSYIQILGFIYIFEEGINSTVLYKLGITQNQIHYLSKHGYIEFEHEKVTACGKLYRNMFLKKYYTEYIDNALIYLQKIINSPYEYNNYIFLPEIFAAYIKYKKFESKEITQKLLAVLQKYSYNCDYKNLNAYGKMAYYFISQKPISAWTVYEYKAIFYYGISLLHCDRKRGAIEIFRKVKNNAPTDLDIYYMAACELINNLYNRFQINDLDTEILIMEKELKRKINTITDESFQSALDMRISYSTCLNRYMMILFMQDEYKKAEKIFNSYCRYSQEIPESKFSDKYRSMLGEWYLDYARGMSYLNPDKAKTVFLTSINMIGKSLNEKRQLLAQLDLAFLNCVYFQKYDSEIDSIHSLVMNLKEKGFHNEYMRGMIRENFCRLIYYLQNPLIASSNGIYQILNSMKEEALKTELNTMLYINGRLAYQIRSYFAALEILMGNASNALYYLKQNLKMAKDAGKSYKNIILHNMAHIEEIRTIKWGYHEHVGNINAYLVDPRIW